MELLRTMPVPSRPLTIYYMYYDSYADDGGLCIWNTDDFNPEMRACCEDPIQD